MSDSSPSNELVTQLREFNAYGDNRDPGLSGHALAGAAADEIERLQRCLFQMQEAAKALAGEPRAIHEILDAAEQASDYRLPLQLPRITQPPDDDLRKLLLEIAAHPNAKFNVAVVPHGSPTIREVIERRLSPTKEPTQVHVDSPEYAAQIERSRRTVAAAGITDEKEDSR